MHNQNRYVILKISIVVLSIFQPSISSQEITEYFPCDAECFCHPPPDSGSIQYLVGYGSLIDPDSIRHTDQYASNPTPVIIEGYQRSWSYHHGWAVPMSSTFLGVEKSQNSSFNGVIFQISSRNETTEESVTKYDKKEIGYCRLKVSPEKIKHLTNTSIDVSQSTEFWMYANQRISTPNKKFPIVQSYVDVFLSACLKIEERFSLSDYANICVKSTYGWNKYIVNDRIYPRRPWVHQPNAEKIDQLLSDGVPNYFKSIKIEG